MNTLLKSFQLTTLGACLTLALSAGVLSTTASAAEQSSNKTTAKSSEVRAAQASKITLKKAINIASKKASGTLVSAEFDDDDDKAKGGVYEIEFNTDTHNHEIKVDALTGKVIGTETERLDSGDIADFKTQKQAKINITKAMSIAEKNTNGRVMEIEFKNDRDYADHTSYYEVEVLKSNQIIELNVDANSGSVFNRVVKK
ncbi:PepSY domain-containing protein [Psychrobacter frigidicola]|uniref:PepSY domain-containing protein n=1 Tax=Psychrobacter frigidicola TaxID=45611 RepID=UPI00191AE384|nr:PepSY domain-containing protein [Psychrobacter frigidicola]